MFVAVFMFFILFFILHRNHSKAVIEMNGIHWFPRISSKSNLFFFFFLIVHWGPIAFVVDYFQWCLWCLYSVFVLSRVFANLPKKPFSIYRFYYITQDLQIKQFGAINDLNKTRLWSLVQQFYFYFDFRLL